MLPSLVLSGALDGRETGALACRSLTNCRNWAATLGGGGGSLPKESWKPDGAKAGPIGCEAEVVALARGDPPAGTAAAVDRALAAIGRAEAAVVVALAAPCVVAAEATVGRAIAAVVALPAP